MDDRVLVVAGGPEEVRPGDAVLAWHGSVAPGHLAGCACCRAAEPLSTALSRWHVARVRAGEALPRRLVVLTRDPAPVAAIVRSDGLLRSRFRAQ